MTPQEVMVMSWLEHQDGISTNSALARQFGLGPGYASLIVKGLKRNLWIEQDRHHLRVTTIGEAAFFAASNEIRPEPFAGRKAW